MNHKLQDLLQRMMKELDRLPTVERDAQLALVKAWLAAK